MQQVIAQWQARVALADSDPTQLRPHELLSLPRTMRAVAPVWLTDPADTASDRWAPSRFTDNAAQPSAPVPRLSSQPHVTVYLYCNCREGLRVLADLTQYAARSGALQADDPILDVPWLHATLQQVSAAAILSVAANSKPRRL